MSEVDKTPAQPTSNQCSDCGAGPDDPCGRPYYGPGRCPVGKTPSIENMVQAARASAIDLRRRACPTAADSVEAIAQKAERLHAALTECVKMLTGLVEHRDDAGLISVYPDPYGALNDARETLGLSRLSWNSPEEIQQDIRRSAHETTEQRENKLHREFLTSILEYHDYGDDNIAFEDVLQAIEKRANELDRKLTRSVHEIDESPVKAGEDGG